MDEKRRKRQRNPLSANIVSATPAKAKTTTTTVTYQ